MPPDIRWKQRFQNFDKALGLLQSALQGDWRSLSDLEKEGVIQRFEFTLELGWKTLKDYLEFQGVALNPVTPRSVIKQGFSSGILPEGQPWIDMLDLRNLLSHTYNEQILHGAVEKIAAQHLGALGQLHEYLGERSRE